MMSVHFATTPPPPPLTPELDDLLIFSPLNSSANSDNTPSLISYGFDTPSGSNIESSIQRSNGHHANTASLPGSASTPADRSVRVRVSAKKLREILSPYASDQSLASVQSDVLVATSASPGAPALPPQPPGGPATPPYSDSSHEEPLQPSALPRDPEVLLPAPPPVSATGESRGRPLKGYGVVLCGYLATRSLFVLKPKI